MFFEIVGELTEIETSASMSKAEVHGYEAHGIGSKEFKVKRLLD